MSDPATPAPAPPAASPASTASAASKPSGVLEARLAAIESRVRSLESALGHFIDREERRVAAALKHGVASVWSWLHSTWGLALVGLLGVALGVTFLGRIGLYACRMVP